LSDQIVNQNVLASARERLRLLKFLIQSRAWLVRDAGGVFKFLASLVTGVRVAGGRATIQALISQAAFVRKNDPYLYAEWLERGEPSRVLLSPEPVVGNSVKHGVARTTDILIFLSELDKKIVLELIRSLSEIDSFDCVYLISQGCSELKSILRAHQVDFSVEILRPVDLPVNKKLRCSRAKANKNFVILHTPGAVDRRFIKECSRLHAMKVDAIFCDHDECKDGRRVKPFFKPGYSQELLWDPSYAPAVSVSRDVFDISIETVDFMDQRNSTLKGYEIITKCFQSSVQVQHLPKIYVHLFRSVMRREEVRDMYNSTRPNSFLDLSHAASTFPEQYRLPGYAFKISFVIPTRDKLSLLSECIDSILANPPDGDYEILILDNQSVENETLRGLAGYGLLESVTIVECDYEFNWARLTNDGIRASSGEVIVLLNNDTVVRSSRWCDRLAWLALEQGVGVVGALLLYPRGEIQHAGIVVGYGGYADHIYIGEPIVGRSDEMFVSPLVRRDVLACTGACIAFSRKTFEKLGDFDESLVVAGDVEYCIRSYNAGFRNIFDPSVRLIHEESETRNPGLPESDKVQLRQILKEQLEFGDPFYNPNLSLSSRSPMPSLSVVM